MHFILIAISIADSSTLRYHVAQRWDNIVHECMSHACVARQYRPNAHNGPTCRPFDKQCRTAIIISGRSFERPGYMASLQQGNAVPSNTCTCTIWTVLCSLNMLFVQAYDHDDSNGGRELLGWPAPQCRSHTRIMSGQQRCADRTSLIRVSTWSSTKDPLTNCSSSTNDPVISCDNIQISVSNVF